MVGVAEARKSLADEWREKNPQSPAEIAAFYRDSHGLAADLAAWHETPERRGITAAIVAAGQSIDASTVLDVGAGMGQDLLALDGYMRAGVEPNDVLRQWLNTVAGIPTVATIQEIGGSYDLILCIDVLEHVPDPAALIEAMISRLAPGGMLIERTSTHDAGTPLHLESLRGWTPARILHSRGFIPRWNIDHMIVWQHSEDKIVAAATVLLCAYRSLSAETSECLTQLGWPVAIHRGDALISRVRSRSVSQWLQDTDEDVFLMIDDDIAFKREDAAKVVDLARRTRSIACGAYPVRDGGHLACRTLVPGEKVGFGDGMEPMEIRWAATGFMAAHRDVCEQIAATMPICQNSGGQDFWPLFMPAILTGEDGVSVYLSEDYAFCERARELGFKVWLDPSVGLIHYGQTPYTVWKMPKAELVERSE